ncbi:hypothetical protein ZIOFF_035305 [Zingiber officinale]|uniref:Alliinase C-terminal domain-containing protein n=1 Tax=Zingiber officinale TaxID=94328 RepID=A0A8J5G9L0_ZINOF|nr:hypothetical protein ZIOFF_035305 [Zingiber officinale]
MSFLNLAVSFPSSTSTMAEEGKIAPSDPQLEMPNADDFDSQKPQTLDISGLKMSYALISPGMVSILNPEPNELGAGIYTIQYFPSESNLWLFSYNSNTNECINLLSAEFVGDKTKETGVFAILIVFDGMVVDMRFVYSIHCLVGNAIADNNFVIVGACSTQLLQAALYALFPPNTPGPLSSVSAVPYFSVSSITCNA